MLRQTLDGRPVRITQEELRAALKMRPVEVDDSGEERRPYEKIDRDLRREIDEISTHTLRMVASRLEGNSLQETRSENSLKDALRYRERAREERRQEHLVVLHHTRPRRKPVKAAKPATAAMLSEPMIDALKFLSETDRNPLDGKRTPGAATLRALVDRKLIEMGEGPMGYVLTEKGRRECKRR